MTARFAQFPLQCDNVRMPKLLKIAITTIAAGLLLGNALAQDTPAASTPPATQTPASKPSKSQTPAAKKPATATKTAAAAAPLALKTQKDKFSYAIGMRMGASFKKQSVPVDPAILMRGIKDSMAGKTVLTDEEAQSAIMEVQKEMQGKQQEKLKEAAEVNKKEGETFLAANKSKEGVVTLPSGLQYKIEKAGTGPKPTPNDSVVCNYRGTLIDGKEFDSSYKRGQPATFPVTGVIKGWTEALQLMPVGSKWQLFIPADLAYGDRGAGGDIGPGATLIFDIELLSIEDKTKDKSQEKTPPTTPEKK
jgi:FKBP-type peptidyl-prolyl cis-trans isomerase FklB